MAVSQHDCEFLKLFGDSVLGRMLADQHCNDSRSGFGEGFCKTGIVDPMQYSWAFAWGMAFALRQPEWARSVLSEFHPSWQDPDGHGEWPPRIDSLVSDHPTE